MISLLKDSSKVPMTVRGRMENAIQKILTCMAKVRSESIFFGHRNIEINMSLETNTTLTDLFVISQIR